MGNLWNDPVAAQAFTRFGLGGRPDDDVPSNPTEWLTSQITCADEAPMQGMPTVAQNLAINYARLTAPPGSQLQLQLWAEMVANWTLDLQSSLTYAVGTKIPFRERLVWFWTNHFAVMALSDDTICTAGPYVRDAIRPNMTGTIAQMLWSVINHAAMILSLDAQRSIGPNSPKGIQQTKHGVATGINENLGRETLELYTVGIGAGYQQSDVDALAYLLTGLNVNQAPGAPVGAFWDTTKLQPGSFTVMGKTFASGIPGLQAAVNYLGTHPATYAHLATKLVTHFVSDNPSQADIETVTKAFSASGGSLPAAHAAIVGLKNAWVPLQKLRTPRDFLVAAMRAANLSPSQVPTNAYAILSIMSMPLWQSPFPNGWPDLAVDWTGPQPMLLRADWSNSFASQLADGLTNLTPKDVAVASVAPLLAQRTITALEALPSADEQFALLFLTSEFQRR
jgi:uncharacterized protein (DUF1800 family)